MTVMKYPFNSKTSDRLARAAGFHTIRELELVDPNHMLLIPKLASRGIHEYENPDEVYTKGDWLDAVASVAGFSQTWFMLLWFEHNVPNMLSDTAEGHELRTFCGPNVDKLTAWSLNEKLKDAHGDNASGFMNGGTPFLTDNQIVRAHNAAVEENKYAERARLSKMRHEVTQNFARLYPEMQGKFVRIPSASQGRRNGIIFKTIRDMKRNGLVNAEIERRVGTGYYQVRHALRILGELGLS